MKKFLGTLLLLIVIAFGFLWLFRANIASNWISRQYGLNAVIQQFNPSPWGLTMKGAIFHQPDTNITLKIGSLSMETPFMSILDQEVVVEKLHLDDVSVISEMKIDKIDSIFNFINHSKNNTASIEENSQGKKFAVHEIVATNVSVRVDNPIGQGTLFKTTIPSITLKNVAHGDALSLESLVEAVSERLLKKAHEKK